MEVESFVWLACFVDQEVGDVVQVVCFMALPHLFSADDEPLEHIFGLGHFSSQDELESCQQIRALTDFPRVISPCFSLLLEILLAFLPVTVSAFSEKVQIHIVNISSFVCLLYNCRSRLEESPRMSLVAKPADRFGLIVVEVGSSPAQISIENPLAHCPL